jgi:hypothetical protein
VTADPEELVRLQGYGEMTLRTAIATLMTLAPRDRSDAAVFRIRDGERFAPREIADLASILGIASADHAADPHWADVVRRMVREAPLPSLLVAFLLGVVVARR